MLGAKISDLMLGEKNVVDFVDKNLLQERDRLHQDELETEYVCQHLVGGILDYPVMISHDFCDITTAWDVYLEAFTKAASAKLPKKHGFGIYPKSAEKNARLGKMPFRGDELTVKQFLNAVIMCCPKIRNHIIDCTEECTASGRLENIYVIISNVVFIRNYIWIFLEIFEYDNKAKLKEEYKNFCDLVEVISEQLLQFQANLLTTYILHDEQSQNWSAHQPYYEGERGSPTIQMWSYFLRAFQRDMWVKMPPQLSQRILAIIINDSLAILASRYSKINPTEASNPQFVCDIINILATVEELLFFICTDVASVCGQMDPTSSKVLFSIHLKSHCLAASLLVVGCPLEVLYKSFRRGLSSCPLFEANRKDPVRLTDVAWMKVLSSMCPKFYPANLEHTEWQLLFHIKLLRAQPTVNWALVYKVVTMSKCKIAKFVLTLFPTVLAPASDFLLEGKAFQRCKHASCMEADCHGLPKSIPNHLVASCTLYIIGYATSKKNLVDVYRSIFAQINDWSVMDKTQIWNSSARPVWFQSLVDIILPVLKTCVQSLCLTISESLFEHEKKAESSQETKVHEVKDQGSSKGKKTVANPSSILTKNDNTTQWIIELLNALTETLSVIPRGFFMVCEEMDDLIPRIYLPVRNNVPVHFLVTGLYMLLQIGSGIASSILPATEEVVIQPNAKNKKPTKPIDKAGEKTDSSKSPSRANLLEPYLFSLAERLCHLDDPIFDQAIHRLTTQIESMMKQTKLEESETSEPQFEYALEWEMASLKADFLLEEIEGQLSLRMLYWFLVTHGDAVEDSITGELGLEGTLAANGVNAKGTAKVTSFNDNVSNPGEPNTGKPKLEASGGQKRNEENQPRVLKIAPRIRTAFKNVNIIHDFHYVNRYRVFDEMIWNSATLDWVQTIRNCRMGLRKNVVAKLLGRRWELDPEVFSGITTAADIKDEKKRHLYKMVNEIKALIMT